MTTYTLSLPYPPSSNVRLKYNGRRVRRSDEANIYKMQVLSEIIGLEPMEGDIYIVLDYYRPQKSGDLQNYQKELFDVLQQKDTKKTKGSAARPKPYSAYYDDSQVKSFHPTRYEDKHDPRVELIITNEIEIYRQAVIDSLNVLGKGKE